ncbi:Bsp6I family type II restriction endonuclease [uncultured Clostridium sp.]|uniref:Bsp6I family type II restriction endonuclease n=1 Tax=uncultured Clostridium sp. TaxID=59620 RepID=UPI0025ECC537|nr:Bsp6I family type II restriction endonuclease [uncultured Clostridium sp.]
MKRVSLQIKTGEIITGDEFEEQDFQQMKSIFKKWQNINVDLKSLGGRALNVPDVFSEGLFCYFFNAIRTNQTAHSYDCVMKNTGEGVQVKSASIPVDCTSFGPTSTWDLLYFVDFAPNGVVDGEVWFYKIDDSSIYDLVLNSKKNETFKDQQLQGRRPRFSMKKALIEANNLQPVKKVSLL